MLSSRNEKRALAGFAGGTTYYLCGGLDFSFQWRENAINAIGQGLDYAAKKITALNPAELVELLASPDDTKVPGTYFTVGEFKKTYAEACELRKCPNLLANLSDACQGKMYFPVTAGITQGTLALAIDEFKRQALAITDAGKALLNPGINGLLDTSIGQMVEKGADTIAKGAQIVASGFTFFAAEKIHDRFHANENGYFAYILCGIVSGAAAQKSQEQFANALALVTTGQNALSSTGLGLAVHALSLVIQVGIRELEEPATRTAIKNNATAFINSAINFVINNGKLLLAGAGVATIGVCALTYANSNK